MVVKSPRIPPSGGHCRMVAKTIQELKQVAGIPGRNPVIFLNVRTTGRVGTVRPSSCGHSSSIFKRFGRFSGIPSSTVPRSRLSSTLVRRRTRPDSAEVAAKLGISV